jgi:hypothetical protein
MTGRTDVDEFERRLIVQNAREYLAASNAVPEDEDARRVWVWSQVGGLGWHVEMLLRLVELMDPTLTDGSGKVAS